MAKQGKQGATRQLKSKQTTRKAVRRYSTTAHTAADSTARGSQSTPKENLWRQAIDSLKARKYSSLDEARSVLIEQVNAQMRLALDEEAKRNLKFVLSLDLTLDELLVRELDVKGR